ncbi:MAG TPA: hypothetical protein VMV86_02620 [Methanosarcinales archaeon]|nr:hypothetical protein [Methanosarcinales archaeon]
MTRRYKYNTLCEKCRKRGIEEEVYVGHWSYEVVDDGIKVTTHCHCNRGHRWKEVSETIKEELPVLPKKIFEDIFISKENIMKSF